MFTYVLDSGEMIDPHGQILGTGYSGSSVCRNNPSMQNIRGVGPLPCGFYGMETIVDSAGHPCDYGDKKAPVIALIPDPSNEMCGRYGFLIHGDNDTHTASDGCIIQEHPTRVTMSNSSDKKLQVIATLMHNVENVRDAATGEN